MSKLIMVVDDDPGVQEFLQLALETEGYETIVAQDGRDALEKLATAKPELIILDFMMPRMNGYDFAKLLRQQAPHAMPPLLVLTADGRAKDKGASIGAEAALAKPFDLIDLLETISKLLSNK